MIRLCAAALAATLVMGGAALAMAPAPSTEETSAKKSADYEKASDLIDEGRYAEAVPLLEKVVENDPGNADAWSQLGFASRKSGKWSTSEMYYAKALALDPKHQEAMEYLGELYLETDRPELAQTMLDKLVTLCPDGCEARSELEEAIDAFKRKKKK